MFSQQASQRPVTHKTAFINRNDVSLKRMIRLICKRKEDGSSGWSIVSLFMCTENKKITCLHLAWHKGNIFLAKAMMSFKTFGKFWSWKFSTYKKCSSPATERTGQQQEKGHPSLIHTFSHPFCHA